MQHFSVPDLVKQGLLNKRLLRFIQCLIVATLAILNKKITTPGVQIPIQKEVYEPILEELKEYGIRFNEQDVDYLGYNPKSVYDK